jgi:hypothetical protein
MSSLVLASFVDTTLTHYERPVLMVGGRPFLYRGAQLRADTMRLNLGWSDDEIGAVVKRLKADGFTVVSIPLFWTDVEPNKDIFVWDRLDRYMEWCAVAEIKLEIAWFGSDSTAYSRGTGANMDRVPDYVVAEYELVTRPNGEVFTTPTHSRVLLDKTDPGLLERESFVVKRLMERVAERDAALGGKQTVIGIQLLNEPAVATVRDNAHKFPAIPRSYSTSSNKRWHDGAYNDEAQFRRDVLLDYLGGLADDLRARVAVDTGDTLRHRLVNRMLHKIWIDIATRTPEQAGGRTLAFFNPHGRLAMREMKALEDILVHFRTDQQGAGIAVCRSPAEIILSAHGRCEFRLPATLAIADVSSGFFDGVGRWDEEGKRGFSTRDGLHVFELSSDDCLQVRLVAAANVKESRAT